MKFLSKAAIIFLLIAMSFAVVSCANSAGDSSSSNGKSNKKPKDPPVIVPTAAPTAKTQDKYGVPLTLEFTDDGEITIEKPWSTLRYTKNNGELTAVKGSGDPLTAHISVKKDDKIAFYAEASENDNGKYMNIDCSSDCYIYGNIMSLITLDAESNIWDSSAKKLTTECCFDSLFTNNSGIKNHKSKSLLLPATTLADSCYTSLFYDCTSLTSAPELPATTLADSCYMSMFGNCTSLTSAPELPATTLYDYCYSNMFNSCTSLSSAPELPAAKLDMGCYEQMFEDCSSLNYIKCLATDISATDCTTDWVSGVAASGTFVRAAGADWSGKTGDDGIPSGWTVEEPKVPMVKTPLTLEFIDDGEISISSPWSTLKYTRNGGQLTKVNGNISVYKDDKIAFYAEASENGGSNYMNINCNSDCYIYGNIMSLVSLKADSNNWDPSATNLTAECCFYNLFSSNSHIKNHKDKTLLLPATTLTKSCYNKMFSGCTSLTSAPDLSATTLVKNCCLSMFENCTSLTSAPKLPATTLAQSCYSSMFKGCSALTSAPELPATKLAQSCYYTMFEGCTALTSAPELPATKLAQYCYYSMFEGCSALTSAPKLPATTLAQYCYSRMFTGCTALTSAPELPATKLAQDCYSSMFEGCSALTSAPKKLPAIELEESCYNYMFCDCIALEAAPELPAATLVGACYYGMFYGCKKLKYIKCLATDLCGNEDACTYVWVKKVAASGTFVRAAGADWSVINDDYSGIPAGWIVEDNTL